MVLSPIAKAGDAVTKRKMRVAVALAVVSAYAAIALAPMSSRSTNRASDGVKSWKEGDFKKAASHFQVDKNAGELATQHFNRGTALASAALASLSPDDLRRAIATLGQAGVVADDNSLRAAALYNAGSAHLLVGKADRAIPLLRGAVLADPELQDAKINLSIALRKIEEEREAEARAGQAGPDGNGDANPGQDTSENSGDGRETSEGPVAQNEKQGGEIGEEGGSENSKMERGQESANSPSEESGQESSVGISPRPRSSKALGLQQKLDALERRSGELRRAGLLKKSSERAARIRDAMEGR